MVIDYEKWREGIGYDLDALRSATTDERRRIERLLLGHGVRDWRDVEALAALDSPTARAALQAALATGTPEIRLAVEHYAPLLCPPEILAAVLVEALERAEPYAGLTQALDRAATFHPPEVIDVLFRAALHRRGEVAPSFAALLMHLHGRAPTRFDMAQRPFFLRFNTAERAEREAAFRELCAKIRVAPDRYLTPAP